MKNLSIFLEDALKKTSISGASLASTYLRGPSIDSLKSKKSDYDSEIKNLKSGKITNKEIRKIRNIKAKKRTIDRLIIYKQEIKRLGT